MKAARTSHYLENQFLTATRYSRKRCKILADDHHAKLAARVGSHPALPALQAAWLPVYAAWNAAYSGWMNARAHHRACTQRIDNLVAELCVTPPGGGRCRLDDWEGRVAGLWGVNEPVYQYLFPKRRAAFRRQGRDAIIAEVLNLATRMADKVGDLTAERDALQQQVDTLQNSNLTPPDALADALELARNRVAALTVLATRITAFHGQLQAARHDQQSREGDLDAAIHEVEQQRRRICQQLYGNMATLIGLYATQPSAAREPQLEVAGFFQFELLRQKTADEEPDAVTEEGAGESEASESVA